ncbi:fibrinogen-like protein 1 [Drosophila montana]|uniref:fibrinogen-like protein 1 n=1 Tax=Drosophila montana TaxID=40370 RepID=UPI00313EE8C6
MSETIRQKDLQLTQQIELTASYKSNIVQLEKQLVSNDVLINNLQSKVKSADSQINEQDKELKKSLLKHENNELNVAKIKQLESKLSECNAMSETIRQKDLQLTQQIELTASYKSNITQLEEQLVSNDVLINNLQSKVKSADSHINEKDKELKISRSKHEDNESNVAKIKQLESKLSEFKAMSIIPNCLGKPSDVYAIKVPDMYPFSVSCDSKLAGSGWIVIQRRIHGSVSFNRGWDEYKAGFGDLRGEFFIGLEKLHKLTQSQPHELYISLKDFQNETRYVRYSNFVIGNETEVYKIKMLGDFTGNTGDSFKYHLHNNFSTPDRDNDGDTGNCALSFQSGWWFTKCYNSNLNGPYTSKGGLGTPRISWNSWHLKPLKFTQMMIKPKSSSFINTH